MQSIKPYHGAKFYHKGDVDFIYTLKRNIDPSIGWLVHWVDEKNPGSSGYSEHNVQRNFDDETWILIKSENYAIY